MNSADGADEHPEQVPEPAFDVLAGGELQALAFKRAHVIVEGGDSHGDRDRDAGLADHRRHPGIGRVAEVHQQAVFDGLLAGVGVDYGAEQIF